MKSEIFPVTPESEIVSSRVLNAPAETVFRAWTNPLHLAKWWGPAGFTNTFHEFDLRPGGRWSFIMHGPDKGNYPNESVFLKIEESQLLAFNHLSEPQFQVVATFEALADGKTKLIYRMKFESEEGCNKLKGFVPEKNEENFDRLEAELRTMLQG